MQKDVDYWFNAYLQWFDTSVNAVGPDLVFLLSIGAIALGVQLNCLGSTQRRALLSSTGVTLTGTVVLGQGAALVAMFLSRGGSLRAWWWITAWLVLIAALAFAAQVVQHVQLIRRLRHPPS
jgi:hypothetical protein